jgi:KGK domain
MPDRFTPLNDDEVLNIESGRILMANPTFKVGELLEALAQAVSDREQDWSEDQEGWFSEGADCEALRLNHSGWQRGRVRIRIEFAPTGQPERLPEQSSAPRERVRIQARPIGSNDNLSEV